MIKQSIGSLFLFIIFFNASQLFAEVKPASVFGDHMVLQQGRKVPVWGKASPGEEIKVTFNGQSLDITADENGDWKVWFSSAKAGGPYEMVLKGENEIHFKDVYLGEVWLCSGQSNMDMTVAREDRYWCGVINEKEEVANAEFPQIRVFDVDYNPKDEPQESVDGKWELVAPETVGHMSAAAYFFARDLYKKYKVPIGLITTAYGASTAEAWTSKPALESHPNLTFLLDNYIKKKADYMPSLEDHQKYHDAFEKWKEASEQAKAEGKDPPRAPRNPDPRVDQHNPCVLYNGMVAPLVPYAIKGAIWYQGESNVKTANVYREIMETMVDDWRQAWGQGDFPFLYVQLANHGKTYDTLPAAGQGMTFCREAQLQNLSIPNTGMAVAIDNADPDDMGNIHPKNKQEIGHRLALAARALVYGENITYSGPVYDYMLIEDGKIRIHFKHTGKGLDVKGGELKGFAIAGDDKTFVHAKASIDGNTIVVYSDKISNPKAVRYGWNGNPEVNLYNKDGLPASPFRTDTFEN